MSVFMLSKRGNEPPPHQIEINNNEKLTQKILNFRFISQYSTRIGDFKQSRTNISDQNY